MANILLIDLPGETQVELTRVLESHAHNVVASQESADAIFCSADGVSKAVDSQDRAPVIVVTGQTATGMRLDALDDGAANYCSEPLEESEVLFTLASVLCDMEPRVSTSGPKAANSDAIR